jgi:glutamate-1-semialdehyde 2,1-aminomutase
MQVQVTLPAPGGSDVSRQLYEEARIYSPNGAQGEGKYYAPYPHFWKRASGARLWDVDDNEYVDYWCAAGPAVLGHNHPEVSRAVKQSMDDVGVLFCAPYPGELQLAKLINRHVPGAEMVGYACGGSDAVCFALRAARAFTGRPKILKFEGHYHGWYDGVLFSKEPGPELLVDGVYEPIAESTGLPPGAADHVIVCPYNDADYLEEVVERQSGQIAAIILEPIAHSMGVVLPAPGFLERARQLCDAHDIALIFDEILTGFRHSLEGAQGLLGVTPDLTAFGKAMSNGFPISAVVGKRRYMEALTPKGGAVFSGTFNGNPLCVSAAIASIGVLEREPIHERLFELSKVLADGINDLAKGHRVRAHAVGYGAAVSLYFTEQPVRNYRDLVRNHDRKANDAFIQSLWKRGFFTRPKQPSRLYFSAAHTREDVDRTLHAVGQFFAESKGMLT